MDGGEVVFVWVYELAQPQESEAFVKFREGFSVRDENILPHGRGPVLMDQFKGPAVEAFGHINFNVDGDLAIKEGLRKR